ncbi:MAG: hypothetical protein COA84_01365 [Robiginitomaculum sp.]|nr:MAG: hypothetical protein COA84_01365 [Robiginitomaculum sp.]
MDQCFRQKGGQLVPLRTRLIVGVFTGLWIGFVAGLLGIGGGFIVAPLLMALGYPVKIAAGTTAMVSAFSSISGFSAHALQGHFPLVIVLIGGAAVLVGALAGSQFMANTPSQNGSSLPMRWSCWWCRSNWSWRSSNVQNFHLAC